MYSHQTSRSLWPCAKILVVAMDIFVENYDIRPGLACVKDIIVPLPHTVKPVDLLYPFIVSNFTRSEQRLAYPIEQLIDARTFECHEVVQQELSTAVQNES